MNRESVAASGPKGGELSAEFPGSIQTPELADQPSGEPLNELAALRKPP